MANSPVTGEDLAAYYLGCANPSAGWTRLLFDLTTPVAPENLTGGFYSAATASGIFMKTQCQQHVDTVNKQLFFADYRQHTVWALTQTGNALDVHKIKKIAQLPAPATNLLADTGGEACMPVMAWCEHISQPCRARPRRSL